MRGGTRCEKGNERFYIDIGKHFKIYLDYINKISGYSPRTNLFDKGG